MTIRARMVPAHCNPKLGNNPPHIATRARGGTKAANKSLHETIGIFQLISLTALSSWRASHEPGANSGLCRRVCFLCTGVQGILRDKSRQGRNAHLRDQLPRLCRAVRNLHPRIGTRHPRGGCPLPRLRRRVRALRRGISHARERAVPAMYGGMPTLRRRLPQNGGLTHVAGQRLSFRKKRCTESITRSRMLIVTNFVQIIGTERITSFD